MSILYFILTAILASITTLIAPTLVMRIRRYFTRKKRKQQTEYTRELIATIERNLIFKIREEVERQLNDVPEERERNQRNKIRKEVDLYLNELRND